MVASGCAQSVNGRSKQKRKCLDMTAGCCSGIAKYSRTSAYPTASHTCFLDTFPRSFNRLRRTSPGEPIFVSYDVAGGCNLNSIGARCAKIGFASQKQGPKSPSPPNWLCFAKNAWSRHRQQPIPNSQQPPLQIGFASQKSVAPSGQYPI